MGLVSVSVYVHGSCDHEPVLCELMSNHVTLSLHVDVCVHSCAFPNVSLCVCKRELVYLGHCGP